MYSMLGIQMRDYSEVISEFDLGGEVASELSDTICIYVYSAHNLIDL